MVKDTGYSGPRSESLDSRACCEGYKGCSVPGWEGGCVPGLGLLTVYEASTRSSRPACEVSITRGHASTAFLNSQVFRPQHPVPGNIGPEVRH